MHQELTAAFIEYFASNRAARGRCDYYGVRLDPVGDDGSEFDLTLTFTSGERYCCAEPGCHTGLHGVEGWRRLREVFVRHGLVDIPPLTLGRIVGIVEPGALLECQVAFGYSEEKSPGYTYESGPYHESKA